MFFDHDEARYRTAILDEDDDDQSSLVWVRREFASLTKVLRRTAPVGRRLRDEALEWLEDAQRCYGHFLLRGAVVRALAQAYQDQATPEARKARVQEAIARTWEERHAGDLAVRTERLSRELAAIARLNAAQRHALLALMDDFKRAVDAAVMEAEETWASLVQASRRSADWLREGLDAIDASWKRPPGVQKGIILAEDDPLMPVDPYQGRPMPRPGDAPLAALVMRPSTTKHLTERGWDTLCGRTISPPFQVVKTFTRKDCKTCRRQAARQLLTCVACGQPRITEGHPGYCQKCSRHRRAIPLGALSLVDQLDRLLEEERGDW